MVTTDRIASTTPRLAQDDKEIEARRTRNMIVTLVILAVAAIVTIYFVALDQRKEGVPYTQETNANGQNTAPMEAAGEGATTGNSRVNAESPTGTSPTAANNQDSSID